METKEESIKKENRLSHRFSESEKQEAVKLADSGIRCKEIMALYQISDRTLNAWRHRLGKQKPVKARIYKASEKRLVLRAIEQGMSIHEAVVAFGINNGSSVREWIKKATEENAELVQNILTMKQEKQKEPDDPEDLKRQLAQAQLKIHALETMIDIAEEQLKIDIRKKSGAKQSPK